MLNSVGETGEEGDVINAAAAAVVELSACSSKG